MFKLEFNTGEENLQIENVLESIEQLIDKW
jgi:hypothetical protein